MKRLRLTPGKVCVMAIKIYIDQGHNPVNPNAGSEGNGLREQDIVYTIGQELARLLRANGNFDVRLSRPTPGTQLGTSNATSLAARVNDANSWGADYFISLHTNASGDPTPTGSEALVFSQPSAAASLGTDILGWLNRLTGLRNRGVVTRSGLRRGGVQRNSRISRASLRLFSMTKVRLYTLYIIDIHLTN